MRGGHYAGAVLLAAVLGWSCGGGEEAEEEEATDEAMAGEKMTMAEGGAAGGGVRVWFAEPADGANTGPDVRVVLETEGIEILSITPPVPGTGHHHIYVDEDVAAWNRVIPSDNPMIIHKGDGTSEHLLEGLEPGEHRLIAVVANPAHIPLDPPVADTVTITVAN